MGKLRAELADAGLVDGEGKLTTGTKPFNLFARIAAGAMAQPEMAEANAALGEAAARYVVCCNRKENDEHWQSDAAQWVGKASMAQRHRFLTTRDLRWRWFNCLSFGLGGGDGELREAVDFLEDMLATANAWAAAPSSEAEGWAPPASAASSTSTRTTRCPAPPAPRRPRRRRPHLRPPAHKNMPASDVLAVLRAG